MSSPLLNRHPEIKELLELFKHEVRQAQRPADEVLLSDEEVMKMLGISKRTLQYIKSERTIPFTILRSRSYFYLSDILNTLQENRIESISNRNRL